MGSATSVPAVPGATGESPAPNPSAMKCAGCDTRNASDGWRRMTSTEVIESARRGRKGLAFLVPNDQTGSRLDTAYPRQREAKLDRERLQGRLCTLRRREAQLVIVAAGEKTLERERALRAGETRLDRRRARQRGKIDDRADLRRLEDVAKIAGESVGYVDRRAREPAQALAERDARGRSRQRMLAVRMLVGREQHAPGVMRERERRIA